MLRMVVSNGLRFNKLRVVICSLIVEGSDVLEDEFKHGFKARSVELERENRLKVEGTLELFEHDSGLRWV